MNDPMQSVARLRVVRPDRGGPHPSGHISDDELIDTWQMFRRTMGAVDSRLGAALTTADNQLSAPTHEALAKLAAAPDGMLPMTELADGIGLTSGGLTKLVDRLVLAGLVCRQPSADDRRVIFAVLTDAGAAQEARSTPAYADGLRAEFGSVGRQGLFALRALCRQIDEQFAARARTGTPPHPAAGGGSRG